MPIRKLAFGLTLPNRGVITGATTVPEMLKLAQRADASGVWGFVWVGDSIFCQAAIDSLTLMRRLRPSPTGSASDRRASQAPRCATRACSLISGAASTSCLVGEPPSSPVREDPVRTVAGSTRNSRTSTSSRVRG